MIEISKNNITLREIEKKNIEFEGKIKTDLDFFNKIESFNNASLLFEVIANNKLEGYLVLEVVQAMNEFKLARINLCINDESIIDDVIASITDYAVKEYFTVKIIVHLSPLNDKLINSFLNNRYIFNKSLEDKEGSLVEYKMTKPIYLGK